MKHFITLMLGILLLPLNGYAQQSVRGDVNGSGVVDIDDVNAVINIMLHKADPTAGADVNGDGSVDIDDLNIIINVMLDKDSGGSHEGDWVDLGLPSGTLWATRNIGADKPEDYGDYFAWGETTPKAFYAVTYEYPSSYKWWYGYYDSEDHFHYGWTKYCTDSSFGLDGFVDYKTELDLDDDAAAVNWGGGARMPSLDQIKELVNTCSWGWAFLNGVAGQLVTGSNGNSIFLPAAGYYISYTHWDGGNEGGYWSRMISGAGVDGDGVYYLGFGPGRPRWSDGYNRYYGHTVRAVCVP